MENFIKSGHTANCEGFSTNWLPWSLNKAIWVNCETIVSSGFRTQHKTLLAQPYIWSLNIPGSWLLKIHTDESKISSPLKWPSYKSRFLSKIMPEPVAIPVIIYRYFRRKEFPHRGKDVKQIFWPMLSTVLSDFMSRNLASSRSNIQLDDSSNAGSSLLRISQSCPKSTTLVSGPALITFMSSVT